MTTDRIKHIRQALEKGFRYDRRKLDEYREVVIETGVSSTAEGSARVRIGGTEVIAGVKMSIEKPYPDCPDRGNLSVNVELLPLSSPDFEPGPPQILAIEIARVVDRGIRESGAVDLNALCITPSEQVWTLFVDLCTINDEGNLFDASSLAALAAIRDARFPEVVNGKLDYKKRTERKVKMTDTPIEVTVLKMGDYFIVDPTSEEEKLNDCRLTVATLSDGTLCALQKGGDGTMMIDDVDKMITLAVEKGKELRAKLG